MITLCSRSGRVVLYNGSGIPLSNRRYFSRGGRNVIIRRWRILYGNSFYGCHYHILPDVDQYKDDKLMSKIIRNNARANKRSDDFEWDKFYW